MIGCITVSGLTKKKFTNVYFITFPSDGQTKHLKFNLMCSSYRTAQTILGFKLA